MGRGVFGALARWVINYLSNWPGDYHAHIQLYKTGLARRTGQVSSHATWPCRLHTDHTVPLIVVSDERHPVGECSFINCLGRRLPACLLECGGDETLLRVALMERNIHTAHSSCSFNVVRICTGALRCCRSLHWNRQNRNALSKQSSPLHSNPLHPTSDKVLG